MNLEGDDGDGAAGMIGDEAECGAVVFKGEVGLVGAAFELDPHLGIIGNTSAVELRLWR